jgi:TolB-like protein
VTASGEAGGGELRRALLLAGVVGGVCIAIAFALFEGRASSQVSDAADRLAVLPFAPADGDTALARIGTDLAVTVAAALDRMPELVVLDPERVLARSRGRRLPAEARAVAEALAARYYVSGSIERGDAAPRLTAELRPVAQGYTSRVVVPLDPADLVTTTDRVARGILFVIWRSHNMPEPSLAAAATASPEALHAWLAGHRALAARDHAAAAAAFARAVAADGTFLLAWEGIRRTAATAGDTAAVRRAAAAIAALGGSAAR